MNTVTATVATTSDDRPSARIVVVDDDAGIREVVGEFLAQHGYAVETAGDGQQMESALARGAVDLVVLDVMLPGEDGLSLCRKLSGPDGPAIIIVSALGEDVDRIVGLELGADHYLAKPCNPRELLARVRAVLRWRADPSPGDKDGAAYEFAGWRLNPVRHELRSPDGALANLPSRQFSLLRAFVERPQRLLTRDQLLEYSCGPDADAFDRAIDVGISRLRGKLDESANDRGLIRTIRGEGYMFTAKVARSRSSGS
jgi:two-component system OmpR family response regulator